MRVDVLKEAIQEYQTPSYLFDIDTFKENIRQTKRMMGEQIQLVYAMKANPFLTKAAVTELEGIEVCSPGEFAICEENLIPMDKIILSGVYKARKDIEKVLETYHGMGVYTVESVEQLKMLNGEAGKRNLKINILLRLTSGNQFGMDEGTIREIVKTRKWYENIHVVGLQFYSGTQKKAAEILEREVKYLDEVLNQLENDYGFFAEKLEYGPGLFVSYFQKEKYEKEEIRQLKQCLNNMRFTGKIVLELGRYLAASCGYYITRIVDKKENCGQEYAIVDGGIHHLNYYGQTMAMKLPYFWQLDGCAMDIKKVDKEESKNVNVCGALCTVSDVLVKNMPLAGAYEGDVLVFQNTGAYSVTEGISLFLSRNLPKVLVWSEKGGLKLKRESIESSQFNN